LEDRTLLSTAGYVAGLYQTLLQRTPQGGEAAPYVAALNDGSQSPMQVALEITLSAEYRTRLILTDYKQFLNRPPTAQELAVWMKTLPADLDPSQVAAAFLASPEFYQSQGATSSSWLAAVYGQVLGRQPDPTGLSAWEQDLSQGLSRSLVTAAFLASPESLKRIVAALYQQVFHRGLDPVAPGWVAVLTEGITASELSAFLAGSAEFIAARGGLDVVYPFDQQAAIPMEISSDAEREQQNMARTALGHAPILFLGDSITEFLALGTGQPLWQKYLAPLDAVDFAMAGLETREVLWQTLVGQVAAVTPAEVVLMVGINDLDHGQSPQVVVQNIAEIVAVIKALSPTTNVLLLGILPRGSSATDPIRAAISQVNSALAAMGDHGRVHFLDIGSRFLQPDGTISSGVLIDGIHPTLAGYELFLSAIWPTLLELAGLGG
jgi:lysophospholipase L1-like esterase